MLTPLFVQKTLLERRISLFTVREFRLLFDATPARTKYFLETYTKQGLFMRLKPGLYAFTGRMPTGEEIANALYRPSYISFEYALAKYGIIPESVYVVTSATTKPTRFFEVKDQGFEYLKIKREAFTGYVFEKKTGEREYTSLIAEPEKALVDYLYFVAISKKSWNDRFDVRNLNKEKIMQYAALYNRKRLISIITQL
jgi:predicted transcriptional regulator of viral defense system